MKHLSALCGRPLRFFVSRCSYSLILSIWFDHFVTRRIFSEMKHFCLFTYSTLSKCVRNAREKCLSVQSAFEWLVDDETNGRIKCKKVQCKKETNKRVNVKNQRVWRDQENCYTSSVIKLLLRLPPGQQRPYKNNIFK